MKKHIPNILTCCNLICGCVAVVCALDEDFPLALLFIIIGGAFDFADGFVARGIGVSSPIGKELDSLADTVTFGVAPSAILYFELGKISSITWLPYTAFLLASFSAVRLAKFNLDTRQSSSFIGFPTPANALLWSSLLAAYSEWFEKAPFGEWILISLMLISCFLLVCEMPMFAMKFKSWGVNDGDNAVKYIFLAIAVVVFVGSIAMNMVVGSFAIIIVAYILLSLIVWFKTTNRR